MAELTRKEKWHARMLAKYGSDEAISEAMRANAQKSTRNSKGPWYFSELKDKDPDRLKDISRYAAEKKARNNRRPTEEEAR